MTIRYEYKYADGTRGRSPWKQGPDGKTLLNREGGFLEEGEYMGYYNAEGVLTQGTPAGCVGGYPDPDPAPTPRPEGPQNELFPSAATPVAPAPTVAPAATPATRLSWFRKLKNWFKSLFV